MTVLAVSSGGGHWEQLMLLKGAFSDENVAYANTISGLAEKSGVSPSYLIADCNRDRPVDNLRCARDLFRVFWTVRPNLIVTTGAAPGLLAIAIGKLFGAKGVWIDSVANSERLSMSGKIARSIADLHLTQWEHLAVPGRTEYVGGLL